MMGMGIEAIVFDFDGVLAESVSIKGDAFVELYKDESQEIQKQVRAYHDAYGGVTRFEKITYYENELCKRGLSEGEIVARCDDFAEIVEQMVVECAWVPGARAFLDRHHGEISYYVASAAPEDELMRIVNARGMGHYFDAVYGAPGKKSDHISNIVLKHDYAPQHVFMIGDAMSDYDAAKKAGVQFIGRRLPNRKTPFPNGTVIVDDLSELDDYIRIVS